MANTPFDGAFVNDPVDNTQRVLVRQTATGFEQGIAATAGLFTAGPLGALASWATIRGTQGKWTPWFILGLPLAPALLAVQGGVIYGLTNTANQPVVNQATSAQPSSNELHFHLNDNQPKLPRTMPAVVKAPGWGNSIPAGMAEFYSTQSGTTEVIGVDLSDRRNANGDVVYDANWSDGYKSSYVFWRNGKVEIFSKDGNGKMTNMPGRFIADGNGGIVITAKSGSRTTFPNLVPSMN